MIPQKPIKPKRKHTTKMITCCGGECMERVLENFPGPLSEVYIECDHYDRTLAFYQDIEESDSNFAVRLAEYENEMVKYNDWVKANGDLLNKKNKLDKKREHLLLQLEVIDRQLEKFENWS